MESYFEKRGQKYIFQKLQSRFGFSSPRAFQRWSQKCRKPSGSLENYFLPARNGRPIQLYHQQTATGHYVQFWEYLTKHATITLNMVHILRIEPTKSAHEQLHGKNWNAYLLTPPGTRAVIYKNVVTRVSWAPEELVCGIVDRQWTTIDVCSYFYVPEHKLLRISSSFGLFPQHYIMFTFTPECQQEQERNS